MSVLASLKEVVQGIDEKSRRIMLFFCLGCLALAVAQQQLTCYADKVMSKAKAREKTLREMIALKGDLLAARAMQTAFEVKAKSGDAGDSPAKATESAGLAAFQTRTVFLRTETHGALSEDVAEVRIEKIRVGDFVNVVYNLKNSSRPLVVRRVAAKTRVDDPTCLDAIVEFSLVKAGKAG